MLERSRIGLGKILAGATNLYQIHSLREFASGVLNQVSAILERAAKMVDGVSYLTYGAMIAGGHHEHYDGAGYPNALTGRAIPLCARIVAVVDVFDALLHRRPYKEPWPYIDVVAYIRERRGTQFDPEVVDALLEVIERHPPPPAEGD